MQSERGKGGLLPVKWDTMLAFALGRMGMSPASFWQMTPRELRAAMAWHAGSVTEPPGRDELTRLMNDYPDVKQGFANGQ